MRARMIGPAAGFSALQRTLNTRPTLLHHSHLKVSDVGFPQFLGQKERTASFGADSDEPAREGYRFKC